MSDKYLVFVSIGLVAFNVFQFIFWSWQNQTLVNKLMCRDLAEYNYITNKPEKSEPSAAINDEYEQQQILAELNGILAPRAMDV